MCNTNPAKTIVQKVTKQQSLGLMQYRLYRNSHDEMCRSGTVNTKEPRRRLIFQPIVCVLDFPPKISIQQNRHLQPSKLWWKCAVRKRPWRNRSPEAMKIRSRQSKRSTWYQPCSVVEDVGLFRLLGLLEPCYHIPSYKIFTACFLISTH